MLYICLHDNTKYDKIKIATGPMHTVNLRAKNLNQSICAMNRAINASECTQITVLINADYDATQKCRDVLDKLTVIPESIIFVRGVTLSMIAAMNLPNQAFFMPPLVTELAKQCEFTKDSIFSAIDNTVSPSTIATTFANKYCEVRNYV